MDQEYLEELRKKNDECQCFPLTLLRCKSEDFSHLERECASLSKGLDPEKPEHGDLLRWQEYRERAEQLQKAFRAYNEEIRGLIEDGDLNIIYHNPKARTTRQVSSEEAKGLLERDEILTVNCSYCNQQIDILRPD